MMVEIKSTDSPEEIQEKLRTIMEASAAKQLKAAKERQERLKKCFGVIRSDLDPLEIQRQLRNEWD